MKTRHERIAHALNYQSGLAMVEFAVALPFLLLMLVAFTELGRAFYTYSTLTKSVENGARYIAGESLTSVGHANLTATKILAARNLVLYGNIGGHGESLVEGLRSSDITVACTYGTSAGHCATNNGVAPLTVSAELSFSPVMGDTLNRVVGQNVFPVKLRASSVMVAL